MASAARVEGGLDHFDWELLVDGLGGRGRVRGNYLVSKEKAYGSCLVSDAIINVLLHIRRVCAQRFEDNNWT